MIGTITLASSTAGRLGQLVRLLASNRPGEVVAAAAGICRTLAHVGADIHVLADAVERGLQQPMPGLLPPPLNDNNVEAVAQFCVQYAFRLGERERKFVQSIDRLFARLGDDFRPTAKQHTWLYAIYWRLRRRRS